MFDINKYCYQYHHNKLALINKLLPESICQDLAKRAEQLAISGKTIQVNSKGTGSRVILDGGGEYFYKVMDMQKITQYFPELLSIYYSMVPLISIITHGDVVTSPHSGSEITLKIYQGKDATQGWHYDTNAITVLLYLTTNQEGATVCKIQKEHPGWESPKIFTRKIYPCAGSILLMKGREIWHCSEPLTTNNIKIVVPFNYYFKNDTWRPDGIDALVYGNK